MKKLLLTLFSILLITGCSTAKEDEVKSDGVTAEQKTEAYENVSNFKSEMNVYINELKNENPNKDSLKESLEKMESYSDKVKGVISDEEYQVIQKQYSQALSVQAQVVLNDTDGLVKELKTLEDMFTSKEAV